MTTSTARERNEGHSRFYDIGSYRSRRLQLGLQGFFGWDAAGHLFDEHERIAFMIVGLSAVWQIFRQRIT
jgi:hypothetical protein